MLLSYFTEEHISTYSKFVGQPLNIVDANGNKSIPADRLEAQRVIKDAHRLVRVWAENVRDKLFPKGSDPKKKISATNQRGNFRDYLPQTIYPDKNSPGLLLYWIYLWCDRADENKIYFRVLVGLDDDKSDKALKTKLDKVREELGGEDKFTGMLPAAEGLKLSMEELTDWAIETIKSFPLTFDDLRSALEPELSANESRLPELSAHFSNYWIEVTKVKGRLDRLEGDNSVGNALWSPQASRDNKDIYSNMLKAKYGDIVFHFTDRGGITGISKVAGEADDRFTCLDGTEWANLPGYRVPLQDFVSLESEISRDQIFEYKELLINLLESHKGLFYHKKLGLNQNAYFTNVPNELAQLFNQIYLNNTGRNLPYFNSETAINFPKAMPMKFPLNQILYGPPGTGKTFSTVIEALKILENTSEPEGEYFEQKRRFDKFKADGRIEFVTFHQSFSYEDFVEGIRAELVKGALNYVVKDGVFKLLANKASHSSMPYVLIIDEINRGNTSRIFGELITLIESTKRIGAEESIEVVLPYTGELGPKFGIPKNLFIIGTMNTADRSLALIDTALRRRFDFIEKMPEVGLVDNVEGVNIQEMLKTINSRIEALYDREHTIGHAFFMDLKGDNPIGKLALVFENKILPLLEEYFFEDWEKIIKVLGGSEIYTELRIPENLADLSFNQVRYTRRPQKELKELLLRPETYTSIYSLPRRAVDAPNTETN